MTGKKNTPSNTYITYYIFVYQNYLYFIEYISFVLFSNRRKCNNNMFILSLFRFYIRNFISSMINEKICFIQARYKQSFVTMNCNTTAIVHIQQLVLTYKMEIFSQVCNSQIRIFFKIQTFQKIPENGGLDSSQMYYNYQYQVVVTR